ncbi:MAG: hypothetical protein ABJB61_09670 [bacterium]
MQNLHPSLADGRWFTMSLAEQLGNVGSEYERALRWKQRDETHFQNALDRLLELLDLTISDRRWRNHRLKELVRLREVICEELCGDKRWGEADLRNYFLYFGLLARSDK